MEKREKLIIVGCSTKSCGDVKQYYDSDWEIWGLNQLYKLVPGIEKHAHVWFQMHHETIYSQFDADQFDWLKKFPGKVYLIEKHRDLPNSIEYPLHEILKNEAFVDHYFTNIVCYMLALAWQKKFRRILLLGVDMNRDDELQNQRPGLEYYIGYLRGQGVKVILPLATDVLRHPFLYGYENSERVWQKVQAEIRHWNNLIGKDMLELEQKKDAMNQYIGALGEVREYDPENADKIKECESKIFELDNKVKGLRQMINQRQGLIEGMKFMHNTWDRVKIRGA